MIEVGDYVRRGKSTLTWKVLSMSPTPEGVPFYALRSGQSGRVDHGHFPNLTLHTKGAS